jgi:hypothetical protein
MDDRARLLRVESATGHIGIAALAVFGASPETLGRSDRRISADYPGVARRALEDAFGGVGLFLVGASGGSMLPVALASAPPGAPPGVLAAPAPSYGEAVARALVVAWSGRGDARDLTAPDACARGLSSCRSKIPPCGRRSRPATAAPGSPRPACSRAGWPS